LFGFLKRRLRHIARQDDKKLVAECRQVLADLKKLHVLGAELKIPPASPDVWLHLEKLDRFISEAEAWLEEHDDCLPQGDVARLTKLSSTLHETKRQGTLLIHAAVRQQLGSGETPPSNSPAPPKSSLDRLVFKSSQAAFEYSCKYMDATPANPRAALVEWAMRESSGLQLAGLKVASRGGGVPALGMTTRPTASSLVSGTLVAWALEGTIPPTPAPKKSHADPSLRYELAGKITAKLKPELDIRHGWTIAEEL
jgi:hypothetical protein